MHPFALAFAARAQADGAIAALSGSIVTVASAIKREERARGGALEFEASTVATAAPFTASIGVRSGAWAYTAASGQTIASTVKADGQWHQVALSHYTARGETLFFVDGALAGRTNERLETNRLALGGQADLKDLMIYRSALNADEVSALNKGRCCRRASRSTRRWPMRRSRPARRSRTARRASARRRPAPGSFTWRGNRGADRSATDSALYPRAP
jgi:hypothetical protein